MAEPILTRNGAIVTDGGRVVLGRCDKCCGDCWFHSYFPCFDRDPDPQCPRPDPVFVTSCWRCTFGDDTQVLFDQQGYCWQRDATETRFLPNPGTGEDPPDGFQWIPDGAEVWDRIEGPCAEGCRDTRCRTFDVFLPARKCPCAKGGGPDIMYVRCNEIDRTTPCIIGRDARGTGDCYEVDREAQSVGDVPDELVLAVLTGVTSCCECCSTAPGGSECVNGRRTIRDRSWCPRTEQDRRVDVCCSRDTTVDTGYGGDHRVRSLW